MEGKATSTPLDTTKEEREAVVQTQSAASRTVGGDSGGVSNGGEITERLAEAVTVYL